MISKEISNLSETTDPVQQVSEVKDIFLAAQRPSVTDPKGQDLSQTLTLPKEERKIEDDNLSDFSTGSDSSKGSSDPGAQ
jgi:hypothetical protein